MKYFTKLAGNGRGEAELERVKDAIARRRAEIALVAVVLAAALFLPLPATVIVKPVCTHGERLPLRKETAYRIWWYAPFAPQYVTRVVLCERHRAEENRAFEKGVDYFKRGIYPLAIGELAKVTWPHEKYEEAQFYMRKARKALELGGRDPSSLDVDGYQYLLPGVYEQFVGGPVFKDEAYAAPMLGRSYRFQPPQPAEIGSNRTAVPGAVKEFEVSLYRFRSEPEAASFAQGKIAPVYPASPKTEVIGKEKVYFGRNAPYYGAVFVMGQFVYEVSAFGTGAPSAVEDALRGFCAYLINIHEGTK